MALWKTSLFVAVGSLACAASMSLASETITYKYDARGRLIQVVHSGSVNNNVISNYTFDNADNRTRVKTTGSPP